ncbi:WecB/TagA/CpsF family glycosyltransferase [Thalassobacillus devorans]|uniref:WecB/TagA/CpsF family glycosyltransferase n=1 Tax=Thalassobacillus devorans TaxID=279813 RepID=UPI00048BCD4E|nr:WecB/TagA/CpsF family glycosyltransferase [Thalassobacillus devorans]
MNKFTSYVSIKGIPFINITQQQLLKNHLYPALDNKGKNFVVTANPEIVMAAESDLEYKYILQQEADYVVADGIGIIIASKIIKKPLPERIPGYDLMLELLDYGNDKKLKCYLLGATDQVAERAADNIKKAYPELDVCGYHHGYFDDDDKTILEEIKSAAPDLIFVALGFPRQEKWIFKAIKQLDHGLMMGVGGSLDVWAGEMKRAPKIWQRLNLEWLYRLIKRPSRWKRMLQLPRFLWHIIRKK